MDPWPIAIVSFWIAFWIGAWLAWPEGDETTPLISIVWHGVVYGIICAVTVFVLVSSVA